LGGNLTETIFNVIVVKSYHIDLLMAILLILVPKYCQHTNFSCQMWAAAEVNFVRSYSNIIVELHFLEN
jgi:hypothetical protein